MPRVPFEICCKCSIKIRPNLIRGSYCYKLPEGYVCPDCLRKDPSIVQTIGNAKAKVILIKAKNRHEVDTWKIIECPYCGQSHIHGVGNNNNGHDMLGGRGAHCNIVPHPNDYELVLAKLE